MNTKDLEPRDSSRPPERPAGGDAPEGRGGRTPRATRRIETMVTAELGVAVEAEGGRNWLVHPPRDLIGIALSGGGIRSATFNLGVLQALDRARLLGTFDYLSTVSGGGYVGGFWTRWRSRGGRARGDEDFPGARGRHAEPVEIRHLRRFSNFLSPRMGLTVDTGRMLISGLSSAVPSILAALAVIVLALAAWLNLAALLFAPARLPLIGAGAAPYVSALTIGMVTLVFLAAMESRWRSTTMDPPAPTAYRIGLLIGVGVTVGTWEVIRRVLESTSPYGAQGSLPLLGAADLGPAVTALLAPAAALGMGVLVFVFLRWFGSRAVRGLPRRLVRAALDRVQMRLLMLASLWVAFSAVWVASAVLRGWMAGSPLETTGWLGAAVAASATLFARLQKVLSKPSESGIVRTTLAKLRPLIPQLLAYFSVLLTVVLVGAGLLALGAVGSGVAFAAPVVGAAVVLLLVLLLLDPNEVALHSFYKARIVRAYLGASNPATLPRSEPGDPATSDDRPRTEEHQDDDIFLDRIPPAGRRPFHLICCAANDQADAGEMDDLRRGASSATLSAAGLSVGVDGAWSPWTPQDGAITLGSSLTASGAAFNSLMGSYSLRLGPAVGFLMSALNLRLGIWLRHPDQMQRRKAEAEADPKRRFGRKPVLIGTPFLHEMFGAARAEGPWVHLSDGGHFENTGVYELVRRHCRIIVASDCGADPKRTFNDVGTLVRRVRQDFGVEITLDLDPLRTDPETGLAKSPVVIGRIVYPDDPRPGVLVLLKPSLVGDEPVDIGQYQAMSPAFPHEATTDQFYDEAQWESYRRLGDHSGATALAAILSGKAPGGDSSVRPLLIQWLGASPDAPDAVEFTGIRRPEPATP